MAYVLTQLLSKSAKAYPEKPAVWARGRSITYRELDERSNQLAHLLREKGINKGDRVGVVYWIEGGKAKADNVSDLTTGASN